MRRAGEIQDPIEGLSRKEPRTGGPGAAPNPRGGKKEPVFLGVSFLSIRRDEGHRIGSRTRSLAVSGKSLFAREQWESYTVTLQFRISARFAAPSGR